MNTQRLLHTFFLACIVLLYACGKNEPISIPTPVIPPSVPVMPPIQQAPDTTRTYLALGDSYTIGQNVVYDARFPTQTAAKLSQQYNILIRPPVYLATTGWTTTNLLSAIAASNLQLPYDFVSVLIGVNDQYQLRDTSNYRLNFTHVLDKAVFLAGNRKTRVFVLSIPDYSVTPFVNKDNKQLISLQIDQFNKINKEVTDSYGISYTDITPGSRAAATDKTLLSSDSLHYSGLEYLKWAAQLSAKVSVVLR